MNTCWIILIALVFFVIAILLWKGGSKGDKCIERNDVDSSLGDEEAVAFERVIAFYEIKFVGAALTKIMTEQNVPFATRHEVWKRYPREYTDPVVGVSAIAEEMQISAQRVYSLLSNWFLKNHVPVDEVNLDGERLRSFLHEKASLAAPKILGDVLGESKV